LRYLKKRATFRGSVRPWVALLHADGRIPNLALMRLSTYFKGRGLLVRLVRAGDKRPLDLPRPAHVFGSTIFDFSGPTRELLEREWGPVVWGGTGLWRRDEAGKVVFTGPSLEDLDRSVDWEALPPDYSLYPDFRFSLGFTQRGCRLRCGFCVVPVKEGKPRVAQTIGQIWRGEGHPRKIVLLDNDPFGVLDADWRARFDEIRGDPRRADAPRKGARSEFRVCFSQGINVRLIDEAGAAALASIEYRNNDFSQRRLYTAWDNLKDEPIFKKGVATLGEAGVPAKHLMVYMLVGYRKGETFDEVMYRLGELVRLGCVPYPMIFDRLRANVCKLCRHVERPGTSERCAGCNGALDPEVRSSVRRLLQVARWVATGLYRRVAWDDYDPHIKAKRRAAQKAASA
jgi:hypothetical protein